MPMSTSPRPDITGLDPERTLAILSYVAVLVFIPLFTSPRSPFITFHAKQGLVILVGLILSLIITGVSAPLGSVLFILLAIIDVIALVQTILGRAWKIPIIGHIASQFNA